MASKGNINGRGDIDFDRVDSALLHSLGERQQDLDGNWWQYLKANTNLTLGLTYIIKVGNIVGDGSVPSLNATIDNDGSFYANSRGQQLCWPQQAFTAGQYGWMKTGGPSVNISVVTGQAAGVRLYTGTTAGVLQNTSSAHWDVGCVTTVGNTTSGAAVIACNVGSDAAKVADLACTA